MLNEGHRALRQTARLTRVEGRHAVSSNDKAFSGSIPKVYETYLVPLIFEGYAADLAGRMAASSPHSVLETAAGSGAVTRALAPRLSRQARSGAKI